MQSVLAVVRLLTEKTKLKINLDIEIWATIKEYHNHIVGRVEVPIVRQDNLVKYSKKCEECGNILFPHFQNLRLEEYEQKFQCMAVWFS